MLGKLVDQVNALLLNQAANTGLGIDRLRHLKHQLGDHAQPERHSTAGVWDRFPPEAAPRRRVTTAMAKAKEALKQTQAALRPTPASTDNKTDFTSLLEALEELLRALTFLRSTADLQERVHQIRQHIINLDRSPRDIFESRSLAREWEVLASMSTMHELWFFAFLCRAKRAGQMHHGDLLLWNIKAAFDEALKPSSGRHPLNSGSEPNSLRPYVAELYARLDEAMRGNAICCDHCRCRKEDGPRTRNHIIYDSSENDDRKAYRAELLKDLPQVLELLGSYFFNRATGEPKIMEHVELALHSVYLAFRSVIYELRGNTNEHLWRAPDASFSPTENVPRAAHLLEVLPAL